MPLFPEIEDFEIDDDSSLSEELARDIDEQCCERCREEARQLMREFNSELKRDNEESLLRNL